MDFIKKSFPTASETSAPTTTPTTTEKSLTLNDLEGKLNKSQISMVSAIRQLTNQSIEEIIAGVEELRERWISANSAAIFVQMKEIVEERFPLELSKDAAKGIKDLLHIREKTALRVTFYMTNKNRIAVKVGSPFNYDDDSKNRPADVAANYSVNGEVVAQSEWFK